MNKQGLFKPITRGAARAVVFLFIISAMFATTSYLLSIRAVHQTTKNSATLNQLCMTGNEFRTDQVNLWLHIVAVSSPPHPTAAQEKQRDDFIKYIHQVFASRNCTRVGR